MTACLAFVRDRVPELKSSHPDKKMTAIMKLIGSEWKRLSSGAKQRFEAIAAKDKEMYANEMKMYVPAESQIGRTSKTQYSRDNLPVGWTLESKTRTSGKSKGSVEYMYVSPTGKRARSLKEVARIVDLGNDSVLESSGGGRKVADPDKPRLVER